MNLESVGTAMASSTQRASKQMMTGQQRRALLLSDAQLRMEYVWCASVTPGTTSKPKPKPKLLFLLEKSAHGTVTNTWKQRRYVLKNAAELGKGEAGRVAPRARGGCGSSCRPTKRRSTRGYFVKRRSPRGSSLLRCLKRR